jgi:hypothetical protein
MISGKGKNVRHTYEHIIVYMDGYMDGYMDR